MSTEKNIKTPDYLYQLFEEYKSSVKENPYLKHVFVGKDGFSTNQKLEKPLTWVGFDVFLFKGKIVNKLADYKANKDDRYSEYANIIRIIGWEIYDDKYSGAAAGVYQNNIIARDLGLKDAKDIEVTDKKKEISELFPEDLDDD